MTRRAVLIGVGEYSDIKLTNLRCPLQDARGLKQVLMDKERGEFSNVELLENCDSASALRAIHHELRQSDKDDFLLIYYSGHGKRSTLGDLYLATSDTLTDALESTALEINKINSLVKACHCRRVLLLLDCCYSGAAGGAIAKDTIEDQLRNTTEGSGIYLITASTCIQTALEKEEDEHSVFTKHLLNGLQSGEADVQGNGVITIDEIYDYLYKKVTEDSHQQPTRWSLDARGNIVIAKSGRMPRQERAKNLQSLLFRLKEEERINSTILVEALAICERDRSSLSSSEKEKDALLDEMLRGKITSLNFSIAWLEQRTDIHEQKQVHFPQPATGVVEEATPEPHSPVISIPKLKSVIPSGFTFTPLQSVVFVALCTLSLIHISVSDDVYFNGSMLALPVMFVIGLRFGMRAFKIGLFFAPIGVTTFHLTDMLSIGALDYVQLMMALYLAAKIQDHQNWLTTAVHRTAKPWFSLVLVSACMSQLYVDISIDYYRFYAGFSPIFLLPLLWMAAFLLPENRRASRLPLIILPALSLLVITIFGEEATGLETELGMDDLDTWIGAYFQFWTLADLAFLLVVALLSVWTRGSIFRKTTTRSLVSCILACCCLAYYQLVDLFKYAAAPLHSEEASNTVLGSGLPSQLSLLILFFLCGVQVSRGFWLHLLGIIIFTYALQISLINTFDGDVSVNVNFALPIVLAFMLYLGFRCKSYLAVCIQLNWGRSFRTGALPRTNSWRPVIVLTAVLISMATAGYFWLLDWQSKKGSDSTSAQVTLPDWVSNPVVENAFAYTECVQTTADMNTLKNKAVALARAKLAEQISIRVKAMDKTYQKLIDTVQDSTSGSTFESVSKKIFNQKLSGSRAIKVDYVEFPGGTQKLCAMVALSPQISKELFSDVLKESGRRISSQTESVLYKEFIRHSVQ